MMRFLKRLPAVVILAMAPVLGVLIAVGGLLLVMTIEQHGRWQQWDVPAGIEVTDLVTASEGSVVVAAADGTLHQVSCASRHADDFCWTDLDAAPDEMLLPCEGQELAPPPARTKDLIATCFQYEYFILTQYALREDGTLWRWQVGIDPLGQVARAFWTALCGLAAGLTMGIAILWFRRQG